MTYEAALHSLGIHERSKAAVRKFVLFVAISV